MKLSFIERELQINSMSVQLQYPIDSAIRSGQLVVVLHAPDSDIKNFGQFHNLTAIDSQGNYVWEAELPTSNTGDRYYKIRSSDRLVVLSVQSYDVTIDAATGRIVSKIFYKANGLIPIEGVVVVGSRMKGDVNIITRAHGAAGMAA